MLTTSIYILIWIAGLAVVEHGSQIRKPVMVLGEKKLRVPIWFAIIAFFPIFWVASQGTPQADTWAYISSFSKSAATWDDLIFTLKNADGEWGYTILCFVIKTVFGNNVTAFRTIIGLIHSIPLALVLRKYSESYTESLFLFVAGCFHTGWMMNGLRQLIAAVIIFAATGLIVKKKYVLSIIIILFAALFHKTAVVMLPVLFFVQGKPWTKKTVFFILFTIVAMYALTQVGVFSSLLEATGYESSEVLTNDDGTNPLRVLVNAVPLIIALISRKYIERQNNTLINVCVNMSLVTTGFYLISMVTSGILLGRLPLYTSLYNLILLPYLIKNSFDKSTSKVALLLMIALYVLYMYVQIYSF
ncbi:MAG: EpsG family protein [Clostridia bacterium]|nr:EpsG family protein [Clostridia bacterium]